MIRSMGRILRCLILLAGGAITTVAVAWGCVLFSPTLMEWQYLDSTTYPALRTVRIRGDDFELLAGGRRHVLGVEVIHFAQPPHESPLTHTVSYAGLPARALSGELIFFGGGPSAVEAKDLLTTKEWMADGLPLRPLWPGFLIDTLFYAATWFGVFFGVAAARRTIRRRRGRCPMCGYDLRGARVEPPATSSGCSECGWNREATR